LAVAVDRFRGLPPVDSFGGRALDAGLALYEAMEADPAAIVRARRSLSDGQLTITPSPYATVAWWVLVNADPQEALRGLDRALVHLHRRGDLRGLAGVYSLRAQAWLECGQLAEAEADAREALRTEKLADLNHSGFFTSAFLSDILMEQGRLVEAQEVLESPGIPKGIPQSGPVDNLLVSRARLLRLKGQYDQALETALATGRRFAAHRGSNPAFIPWRSEAALCLHALGRGEEAMEHADMEVRLARRWGGARALGRSLRVAGLVEGGSPGRLLLEEAVAVLATSTAQLEYAKALAELGAALRRNNWRGAAKPLLNEAFQLAVRAGATPLMEHIRVELHIVGVRRSVASLGLDALTPSELRVAEMAASSASNRDIAQALFITPKTVEAHLSSAYRKLHLTSRHELKEVLRGGDSGS
jgi:DNA-binding CsgD family transcriptional regulator